VRKLWHSPTLRSVAVLGLAGASFALANLLLARVLPATEYALLTLVVALVQVGYQLAPGGVEWMVNRYQLEAGPRLLRQTMRTLVPVSLVFGAIGLIGYETPLPIALMIAVATLAGGTLLVAAGQFQSEQRFWISLAINQSPNLLLFVAALWVVLSRSRAVGAPLLVWTVGLVLTALAGWWILFAERHGKPSRSVAFPWNEAFAIAGLSAAGVLLIQLDRLLIPQLLPLHDLATYGVLAAIVGSLFRVLQMGIGYSLLPRLRDAPSVLERRRMIRWEIQLVLSIVAVGSATIWVATPLVERWFLGDKYHLSTPLILAALVTGVVKIFNGFAQSTVSALADARELFLVSLLGWAAVGLAVLGAIVGTGWGLTGVIYGIGFGWLVRAVISFYLIARHLRLPAASAVVAR
jgi:O-antigen/teichoic acid export membrane protein